MTYITLASILMVDVFPDPEIICKFLGLFQFDACKLVMNWIRGTMNFIGVCPEAAKESHSRIDLMSSLRYKYEDGLGDRSPGRIMLWVAMIGDWPSITNRGARYLLQVREWFVSQAEMLIESQLEWDEGFVLPDMTDEFKIYARFGIAVEHIEACDWTESCPKNTGV